MPTWNGGPRFREVLEALRDQDWPERFELVVIDSGSRDGTRELAAQFGAFVTTIPQSEFNHGATRNRGIALSHGELVILLTQDAKPMNASFVREMVAAFDDSTIDGVYARQFGMPDMDPILKERLRRWSGARSESVTQALVPGDRAASRAKFDALEPMERYLTSAFDNVASAVRRSSWERHPLPARDFGEDVAWAREMLLAGGSIRFSATAHVEHSHPISIKREFKRLYCDHKNLIALFGLRTVPTWSHPFRGWRGQVRFYGELIDASDELPWHERLYWKAYSVPYALAEGVAQFLGARSHWKTQESRFWKWVDGRLTHGV